MCAVIALLAQVCVRSCGVTNSRSDTSTDECLIIDKPYTLLLGVHACGAAAVIASAYTIRPPSHTGRPRLHSATRLKPRLEHTWTPCPPFLWPEHSCLVLSSVVEIDICTIFDCATIETRRKQESDYYLCTSETAPIQIYCRKARIQHIIYTRLETYADDAAAAELLCAALLRMTIMTTSTTVMMMVAHKLAT